MEQSGYIWSSDTNISKIAIFRWYITWNVLQSAVIDSAAAQLLVQYHAKYLNYWSLTKWTKTLYTLKATGGGPGSKKSCWSYLKDSIIMVSTLFTECQNFTPFRSYRRLNVLALWLFYSNLRGHFWHFLYFFWL